MKTIIIDILQYLKSLFVDIFDGLITTDITDRFLSLINKIFISIINIFREVPVTSSDNIGSLLFTKEDLAIFITIIFALFVCWFVKKIFNLFTGYLK